MIWPGGTMNRDTSMRRTELDVAKGFTLFLVVYGHILDSTSRLFCWIFMFHMPAFFFLSGMTFRPEKYESTGQFLRDKWKKRIVPYLWITLIGFVICMVWPAYRQPVLNRGWKDMLMWIFYYGQPKELYIGQVWFLAGLFMAEFIAWLWFRFLGNKSTTIKCYALAALAWAAVNVNQLNDALGTVFPAVHRLPWKIDTGLGAAVFLIAGYYTTKWKLLEKLKKAAFFLIPAFIWLSYYYGPRQYGYVNMCDCIYFPGPYYFPVAFFGIGALLLTAALCKDWKFWQFCGRNSMPVFAAQTFVIYWLMDGIAMVTGRYYTPMRDVPGSKGCLLMAIAVFGILAAGVYGWQRLFLHKSTKK